MIKKKCPNCGLNLIEDAAEELEVDQNGSVVLGGFLAYVCPNQCGFVEKMPKDQAFPQIIADREDALLLLYPNDQGRIYMKDDNFLYPPMHYEALLKFGYWDGYKGEDIAKWIDRYAKKPDEPQSLFSFATSELSQDAFLCWLVQWADPELKQADKALHQSALLFLERIFQKHGKDLPEINTIQIRRQFKGLDILLLVNNQFAILIEDKTYTKDHSNQLMRYRKEVKSCTEYSRYDQLCIYYKSESQSHYRSCEIAEYKPFTREEMINVMERGVNWGAQNVIYLDYLKRLEQIEAKYQSYQFLPVEKWGASAWQGFFRRLQKELGAGDWGYVPNASGGFQGFWWNRNPNQSCYFQIEQMRLCIKIVEPDKEKQREARLKAITHLLEQRSVQELSFQKPVKPGVGKVMTVITKKDYLQMDQHGLLNVKATVNLLKEMEQVVHLS